jgi:6-pyruvoyltetrahydropterin/6-carboxytetrahydropterin synthase
MVTIIRRETFSASHRLFNPAFTDEENERTFGKCNNPNGHGHNYVLEVEVSGEVDPATGYVVDLKELKRIIRSEVVARVDHKHLNLDVDFLRGVIPTAENIAIGIWNCLAPKVPGGRLACVRLRETENNVVEYRGA